MGNEWQKISSQLHTFIKSISPAPLAISFPRPAWIKLNRLRTGIGLFHSETHKWDMAFTAACECDTKEQTAEHVITSYHIYHDTNVVRGFSNVDKSLVTWLKETYPAI